MKILWIVRQDLSYVFFIRFTFWSGFSFYISHDFHSVSTEWILNAFRHWITQLSEYGHCQKAKNQMKRDKPIKPGH